jgi:Family of unknown function (DUF6639)
MIEALFSVILATCLFHSSTLYAQEKINPCNGSSVLVTYTKVEDYHLLCESLNKVLEIAKKIGFSEKLTISVLFVDKLMINKTLKLLAFFNPNSMEVQLLSMQACQQTFGKDVVFGQEIDKELYTSIIIHEIAHALFWENGGKHVLAREIHEYFAYAIQLVLLDEAHRNKIIYSNNVPAYSNRSEISEEYYLMNPTQFAVKSYLHFINVKDDWSYLLSPFNE